jgi:2-keto-3-deoxy-L-rhamnonate aldolase RhmA
MITDQSLVGRTFIVIEPDPIVSMDLAGTLKSAFPESRVNLFQLLTEAKKQISTSPKTACILVSSSLVSSSMTEMLRDWVALGARLVFVGDINDVDVPSDVVQKPFTTQMILSVLA